MRSSRFIVLACALAYLIPSAASAHYVEMRMTDKGFEPQSLEIAAGETVFFVNAGSEPHWVASDDHPTHTRYPGSDIRLCDTDKADKTFDACRGIKPGEVYHFTFDSAGTWKLHDHLHSDHEATIVVTGTSTAVSRWGPSLSPAGKLSATIQRAFYSVFPAAGKTRLARLNMILVTKSDSSLEYWMRVFGYHKLFDKLVRDADDPSKRLRTPDEQNKLSECHVEAHFAGRMAYRLFGFDSLMESFLDTRCAFGFYHGMIEMALGTDGSDARAATLAKQCESYDKDPLRRAFCYHGVGHGLMVYYNFDVPKAAQKCDELSPTTAGKRMCYHGAFMENAFAVAGIGVTGHQSGWSDPKLPDFPCSSPLLPDDKDMRGMCYADQSFIWWSYTGGVNTDVAVKGCERAPRANREDCYRGVGFNMSFAWKRTLSEDEIVANCKKMPTKTDTKQCILGAIFMRSTHWGQFKGFGTPTFCSALGIDDAKKCDQYTREQFAWLGDL